MSNYAIKIENLGKLYKLYKKPMDKILDAFGVNFFKKNYYQEFWALRGLNLEVKKGERLGIIGHNGAGKSTLLKTIIGNISPTEGSIDVNGNIQAMMELGTGFHPEFTGRENIRASLAYQGFSTKEIQEKEEEIIDFSELEGFIDQPIKTYSAGMYARLGFSTATAIEPEILIIDEVLGAGDAYFAGKCVDRMKKLTRDSGATVLFVSHDLNSVLQLCDRVIWVDRGRIRESGEPLEVIKKYKAVVRKQEEERLRMKDLKNSNKNVQTEVKYTPAETTMLFRLVNKNGVPPKEKNKIYEISLHSDSKELATIDVGGPMDNDMHQSHYIIDSVGYMNWGSSKYGENGLYREYCDLKGKYGHAPFEFKIPTEKINEDSLQLKIIAETLEDNVVIEKYDGNQYVLLGELNPLGFNMYKFQVNPNGSPVQAGTESIADQVTNSAIHISGMDLINDISEYGSGEARIINVRILDQDNYETKILEVGTSIKVAIDYESTLNMEDPVFVFCIYLPDGRCASQWVADSATYGNKVFPRKGSFVFNIEHLNIGRGSYIASAAIFKYMSRNGQEAESYHVIDRNIHFEVTQNLVDTIEKGLCIQPFEVSVEAYDKQYVL